MQITLKNHPRTFNIEKNKKTVFYDFGAFVEIRPNLINFQSFCNFFINFMRCWLDHFLAILMQISFNFAQINEFTKRKKNNFLGFWPLLKYFVRISSKVDQFSIFLPKIIFLRWATNSIKFAQSGRYHKMQRISFLQKRWKLVEFRRNMTKYDEIHSKIGKTKKNCFLFSFVVWSNLNEFELCLQNQKQIYRIIFCKKSFFSECVRVLC
jgi:hypothetical protein